MNDWIPVATVLTAVVLMSDSMPKVAWYFLVLILVLLILNRWDVLKKLFIKG